MLIKKILLLILIIPAISILFNSCSDRKAQNELKVATDATWPPMEFIDKNNNLVGFDIDLMRKIGKEMGKKIVFINTAWDGLFAGLVSGEYDLIISAVTITEQRKKKFGFSIPYINAGQVFVMDRKNLKNYDNKLINFESLAGKKIGVQLGTTGAIEAKKHSNIKTLTYDEIGLAFEDLYNNNLTAIIVDNPTAANFIIKNNRYKERFAITGEPFTEEYYGIMLHSKSKKLKGDIDNIIRKLIDQGYIKKLESTWEIR